MSKPRNTRRRVMAAGSFEGVSIRMNPDGSKTEYPQRVDLFETQETVSEGHQWPPPKGSNGDFGGDFHTTKVTRSPAFLKLGYTEPEAYGYWPHWAFKGQLAAVDPSIAAPEGSETSDSDLMKMGASAIAKCKPTNSPADVFTFLAELYKEGLPNLVGTELWKSKTGQARKAASSEYLSFQFGWRPIVNDAKKFLNAVVTADLVLSQFERDAGRNVRRSFRFPSSTETTTTNIAYGSPPYGYRGQQYGPFGTIVRRRTIERDIWFKGCFTYSLPSGYDSRNKMERYARRVETLLGTDITPERLWQIAPWSWAVDWFANTGDVLSNLYDFQSGGLVMRYGYIMETSKVTDSYTNEGVGLFDRPLSLPPVVVSTTTKKRLAANPFGFGVVWKDLSPFQLSILAALGINRGSR